MKATVKNLGTAEIKDGKWVSANERLAQALNDSCPVATDPSMGHPNWIAGKKAEELFGAKVEYDEVGDTPDGVVV